MRIRRLKLANFRSVAEGEVLFPGHTVIIGGNSVGKSTLCEALDLLLGPDLLSRSSPIDEHDFFQRRYLDDDGTPILIELEVVLTDLTEDVLTKFRIHLEYWDTATDELLDVTAAPEDVDDDNVVPALRIRLEGAYDIEEDEFRAECYFASPPVDDEARRVRVTRTAKRQFGFIYLRALRTGARALSLERGSLLDIILKLPCGSRRLPRWRSWIRRSMPSRNSERSSMRSTAESVGSSACLPMTARFACTRPRLRARVCADRSRCLGPPRGRIHRCRIGGWGRASSMRWCSRCWTFIAELKSNVIFAMEEPEIAIPPHTQRRVVQFLQGKMDQSILTTHSPFVLEQYDPANVVLLERGNDGVAAGRRIEVTGIKAKAYKGNLRRVLAEAMLGNGVLCVEGISDGEVIYTASAVLEENSQEGSYTPLDLSGVTVVQCEGDGGLLRYGQFFSAIGLKTYAFYDRQKNAAIGDQIENAFDTAWELEQTGIEYLLADEITIDVIRGFLSEASGWDDYPHTAGNPDFLAYGPDADEDEIRGLCKAVLRRRKGSGYAQRLAELCSDDDLPDIIVEALGRISEDLPNDLSTEDEDDGGDGDAEVAAPLG